MNKWIYIGVALLIIGVIVWYVMRAQRQAAAINAGNAAPTPPTTPQGAGT